MLKNLSEYPIDELKLIYHVLHTNMPQQPQLMGSYLLQDIQAQLLQQAKEQGVELNSPQQWSDWLQVSK
jgi:hypothetical protein